MYQRILVPLDGSHLAEQVLAWVEILAKGMQSRVELLRVIEPPPPGLSDSVHGIYPHRVSASIGSHAQNYLESLAIPLRQNGLSVSSAVQEGNPAPAIASEAAKEPDTLIAMTTHGRSGIGRWLLGSVTDKVLRATTNPLLLVRAYDQENPPEAVKLQSIIVPLDGSSIAEQILPHTVSLARALKLRVLLVRATPSLGEYHRYVEHYPLDSSSTISKMYEEFSREEDARAMQYLHQVKERLNRQRVFSAEERLLKGHAAEAIVEVARETPHSLVAMTTQGRSGIGRWLVGSVADRVVRHSRDLVLVVRAAEELPKEAPSIRTRPV
jgi:nucleotide-binding universal stress UspA family protein